MPAPPRQAEEWRVAPAALPAGPGFSFAAVPVHASATERAGRDGLPEPLNSGVERLSGLAMADVRVHRNSPEPAKLGALAFTKGSDIHLGPGQERHLPHEAWHVVQQKQGRVAATRQLKAMSLNADPGLEAEADRMGAAAERSVPASPGPTRTGAAGGAVVQAKVKAGDRWLEPTDPVSPTLLEFIRAKASYLLRDDFLAKLEETPVHLLDMSKKYLLGEEHGPAADVRWADDVHHWSTVPKMFEEEKALPAKERTRVGLPAAPATGEPGDAAQPLPLESLHVFLLKDVLQLHDDVAIICADWFRLRWNADDNAFETKVVDDAAGDAYGVGIDLRPYAEYLAAYEETAKRPRVRLSAQARRIYEFAVKFRDEYAPAADQLASSLVKMKVAMDAYDPGDPISVDINTESFEEAMQTTNAIRGFLPQMALELMDINRLPKAERSLLNEFISDPDKTGGADITRGLFAARERAMAANISAQPPPLLVQVGDAHLEGLEPLVGKAAVAVPWPDSLETKTAKP